MSTPLSILATHDELVRCSNVLINGSCEGEFLQFAINQEEMRQKWLASVQECQRLHYALERSVHETADLDRKLSHARRLLDEEKKKRKLAEENFNSSQRQIALVRELLLTDGCRNLNDETREKLQFLNNTSLNGRQSASRLKDHLNDKLNTISELDFTGSLLGDISHFSKSEDDLDASVILQQNQRKREWKEHRPSGEFSLNKRRRSTLHKAIDLNNSDHVVATTTLVMPKDGPITASSVIEAKPAEDSKENFTSKRKSSKKQKTDSKLKISVLEEISPAPTAPQADIISTSDSDNKFKSSSNIGGYSINTKHIRKHTFTGKKSIIIPEACTGCGNRIPFSYHAIKCRDCKAVCHVKCRDVVPLPCIPTGNTPTLCGVPGTIADYTPMIPPMVPSLVVHCINEIELRGMNEEGLYRIEGSRIEVKNLKEKFLRGRGAPNLSEIEIRTICSTLKNFLRSLKEPIITNSLRADFVRATTIDDKQDADAALYQAISELPQPNRDTLAFLILHLQRVSGTQKCKMEISNLAKIFGPTLVGYSCCNQQDCQHLSTNEMINETRHQFDIVESLLRIPSDYWANFVNPEQLNEIDASKYGKLKHTTSIESLSKKGFFNTPISSSKLFRKNKRYFATPPSNKVY